MAPDHGRRPAPRALGLVETLKTDAEIHASLEVDIAFERRCSWWRRDDAIERDAAEVEFVGGLGDLAVEPVETTEGLRVSEVEAQVRQGLVLQLGEKVPRFALHRAEARVVTLAHELEALEKADGWDVLRDTELGEAAIAWTPGGERTASTPGSASATGSASGRKRAAEREGPLR